MAITDLTIISRSLTGRLFSTITTIVTVAVAVGLMFVLLAMRESGMRAFSRGGGNMHLVAGRDSGPLAVVLNSVFHAAKPAASMTWAEYEMVMTRPRPGVPPVIGMVDWAIPLQHGDSLMGFPVVATSRAFFERFEPVSGEPFALQAGEFFRSPLEEALGLREPLRFTREGAALQAVVGAEAFAGTRLAVGQPVHLAHGTGEHAGHVHDEDAIEVVGVLKPTGTAHDRAIFIDLGTSWLLHARDFHESLVRERDAAARAAASAGAAAPAPAPSLDEYIASGYKPQITAFYLRAATRRGSDTSSILPQLQTTLRADPMISSVASPSDQVQALFRIVGNINQILLGMAAVVMVSSGIAIMLALYNSMEQRRRQIAVLRVLGASKGRIFGLIVTESALLGLIGAAVGLLLAAVGGTIVAGIMRDRLGLAIEPTLWITEVVRTESRTFTVPITPVVLLATVALAALAGVIPGVMAYRTSVGRSLRPLG